MKKSFVVAMVLAITSASFAGECVLKIKRDACAGKEAAAFKPYNGKAETEEKKKVDNADACKEEAKKAAKIVRKGTLSKKTVTASFDGAAAVTESDSAECK